MTENIGNIRQTAKQFESSVSSAVEGLQEYNLKVLEIARTNADAAFDYAKQVISVKSPSELIGLWTSHSRKQFDALSAQTRELTELGKKVSSATVEPLTSAVAKPFKVA